MKKTVDQLKKELGINNEEQWRNVLLEAGVKPHVKELDDKQLKAVQEAASRVGIALPMLQEAVENLGDQDEDNLINDSALEVQNKMAQMGIAIAPDILLDLAKMAVLGGAILAERMNEAMIAGFNAQATRNFDQLAASLMDAQDMTDDLSRQVFEGGVPQMVEKFISSGGDEQNELSQYGQRMSQRLQSSGQQRQLNRKETKRLAPTIDVAAYLAEQD